MVRGRQRLLGLLCCAALDDTRQKKILGDVYIRTSVSYLSNDLFWCEREGLKTRVAECKCTLTSLYILFRSHFHQVALFELQVLRVEEFFIDYL